LDLAARLGSDADLETLVTTGNASTRVPATQRDETVKALNVLIHDLRAPLSVAQGYLRLLQQDRLEAEADRQRAIAQSMEALGRITRLCSDAAAFVAEPTAPERPAVALGTSALVERVTEACTARSSPLTIDTGTGLTGTVRSANLDRLVQSLAVVLCAVRRSALKEPVRVSVDEEKKEARFLLGCDDDRAALVSGPPETFDPWRGGHGIALPLACRTIAEAGGRIWTVADGRGAVGIALPEEASAP
jgi:light-regulated signal transduction histidine kinase (bacteriophytochrome)